MIPENLKYSNDHEWLKMDGEFAYVGITDYAAEQLGDITFVFVDTLDETLGQNEQFGEVEAVKTSSPLMLPIGGEVVEFNEKVDCDATILNSDPYGEGWIVKIRPTNPAEADTLLDAAQYAEFIK